MTCAVRKKIKYTEEKSMLTYTTYPLRRIEEGYDLFEHKRDGVIKVAVEC